MPYPKDVDAEAVNHQGRLPKTFEELTYLITKFMLVDWTKKPAFSTFIALRKEYYLKPEHSLALLGLRRGTAFSIDDVVAASQLCFEEFMRRVGTRYLQQAAKTRRDPYIELGALYANESMTTFKLQ